jgi:hypothetical protein
MLLPCWRRRGVLGHCLFPVRHLFILARSVLAWLRQGHHPPSALRDGSRSGETYIVWFTHHAICPCSTRQRVYHWDRNKSWGRISAADHWICERYGGGWDAKSNEVPFDATASRPPVRGSVAVSSQNPFALLGNGRRTRRTASLESNWSQTFSKHT